MDDVLALMIPIVAILMVFGIPIVAILTAHQRKMAELYRQPGGQTEDALVRELQALRGEVSELRDRVNQQMLMIDRSASRPPVPSEEVAARLKDQ